MLYVFSLENPYRENYLAVGVRRNASIASVKWQTVSLGKRVMILKNVHRNLQYHDEVVKGVGVKTGAIHARGRDMQSGWWDLNPRPPRPERGALPS